MDQPLVIALIGAAASITAAIIGARSKAAPRIPAAYPQPNAPANVQGIPQDMGFPQPVEKRTLFRRILLPTRIRKTDDMFGRIGKVLVLFFYYYAFLAIAFVVLSAIGGSP
jgi:hypothetical protein